MQFGAVSEQTVLEMARGGQKIFGTQVAIAVSGIAGPGGASPQKPLGTVWIAVAVLDRSDAYHYRFFGTREQIKYQSAESALWLLVRALSRELNEPTLLHQVSALQPLAVEFREQGTNPPQPLAFYWKGERLAIASVGRRWQDSAGEHYLALTYQEKVFELIRRADGCWYLRAPQEALGLA